MTPTTRSPGRVALALAFWALTALMSAYFFSLAVHAATDSVGATWLASALFCLALWLLAYRFKWDWRTALGTLAWVMWGIMLGTGGTGLSAQLNRAMLALGLNLDFFHVMPLIGLFTGLALERTLSLGPTLLALPLAFGSMFLIIDALALLGQPIVYIKIFVAPWISLATTVLAPLAAVAIYPRMRPWQAYGLSGIVAISGIAIFAALRYL